MVPANVGMDSSQGLRGIGVAAQVSDVVVSGEATWLLGLDPSPGPSFSVYPLQHLLVKPARDQRAAMNVPFCWVCFLLENHPLTHTNTVELCGQLPYPRV